MFVFPMIFVPTFEESDEIFVLGWLFFPDKFRPFNLPLLTNFFISRKVLLF